MVTACREEVGRHAAGQHLPFPIIEKPLHWIDLILAVHGVNLREGTMPNVSSLRLSGRESFRHVDLATSGDPGPNRETCIYKAAFQEMKYLDRVEEVSRA